MKHLKKLLKRRVNNTPKWVPIVLGLIALVGFSDATYLTIQHFANEIPPCVVGDCEIVLTSSYSQIIGIPVALLGAIYYLLMLVLVFVYMESKREIFLRTALILTAGGLLAAFWFVSLQVFVIGAYCQYCLVSAGTSVALFVLSGYTLKQYGTYHHHEEHKSKDENDISMVV